MASDAHAHASGGGVGLGFRFRKLARRLLIALAYAVAVVLLLIYILPLLWIILCSLKPLALIKVPPRQAFAFLPTVDNYVRLATEWRFFSALRNSFVVSTGTTLLNVVLATLASFALVRYRLKGRDFVATWILSQRFLPVVAVLLPWFIFYQSLDMIDTYRGLVVANTTATLPFSIWLLRGFVVELPTELYDAAEVDGCNDLGVLLHVVLPLARPAIGVTAVFCFLFSWNEFMIPLVLARTNTATVPIAFAGFRQQFRTDWGAAAAATVVTVLPLYAVVALLQENIIRGLTMGAVKG